MKRLLILSVAMLLSGGLTYAAPDIRVNRSPNIPQKCLDLAKLAKYEPWRNDGVECPYVTFPEANMILVGNEAGEETTMNDSEKVDYKEMNPEQNTPKTIPYTIKYAGVGAGAANMYGFKTTAQTGKHQNKTVFYVIRAEKVGNEFIVKMFRTMKNPTKKGKQKIYWTEMWSTATPTLETLQTEIAKLESKNKGMSVYPDGTLVVRFLDPETTIGRAFAL